MDYSINSKQFPPIPYCGDVLIHVMLQDSEVDYLPVSPLKKCPSVWGLKTEKKDNYT